MSLLTITQAVCARLSLPIPTAVVGSTDKTAQQMFYLAQEEGKTLSRRGSWRGLVSEKTFTTVATAAQTSALPSDLDWIIPETMFDRTLNRRVAGPMLPEEWQIVQSSLSVSIWPMFRIRGTSLLISPTPVAGNTVAYEYVTKNWCQDDEGTGQSAWAADTDTALLDEELMTLGLLWRFKRSKGMEYGGDMTEYEKQVRQLLMRDGVRPRISTDPDWAVDSGDEAIAGARPNVIVTEGGDFIGWD